jgi:predicted RNA-binding protein with PUA domain
MLNANGIYNCPNCGAPISSEKCPYCGTVFYDFSCIDLNEPTYIKFKYEGTIVMCKAVLRECQLSLHNNYADYQPLGGLKIPVVRGQSAEVNLTFDAVTDEDGRLITYVKEE